MSDTENQIKTRRQIMREAVEAAVHLVYVEPGGTQSFQSLIIDAEQQQAANIDAVAHLISTAQAALVISNSGADNLFAGWYQEKAQRLLERAMDALVVIEADREPRPAGGLN